MRLSGSLLGVPSLLLAIACASSSPSGPTTSGSEDALTNRPRPPVLPTAQGSGALAPWGGADAAHWRPEAMLANATSDALNRAWSRPNVKDVVVAVPAKMFASPYAEYGDGQLNSVPSFMAWTRTERPPLIATLVDFTNAPREIVLRVDRDAPANVTSLEVVYDAGGRKVVDVPVARTAAGDLEGTWIVPSEVGFGLSSSAAVAVHPKGWGDWFPLWFRMPVKSIAELHAGKSHFADGKSLVDREAVSVQGEQAPTQTPYERLASHSFTAMYNNQATGAHSVPFNPPDIHARFPFGGALVTTGVGQGWTWVADERPDGFKVMYTCFEGRRQDLEASAPQGGVASGGGFHLIGDPAETILNDLEASPIVVAAATSNPFVPSVLPSGTFAFGLSDVITVRWLYPGEAFVVPRGSSVPDGHGGMLAQDNFHWFYFQGAKNVCTEELVNTGAVPTNFEP